MIMQEWSGRRSTNGVTTRKMIVWHNDGSIMMVVDRDSSEANGIRTLRREHPHTVADLGQLTIQNFRRCIRALESEVSRLESIEKEAE